MNHIAMKKRRKKRKRPLRARLVRKCSVDEVRLQLGNTNKNFIDGEEQAPQMRCTSVESGMCVTSVIVL